MLKTKRTGRKKLFRIKLMKTKRRKQEQIEESKNRF